MGLDMYLNKRIYIGANYNHNNVKGVIELTQGHDNEPIKIKLNKVTYIIENVGYWRKANHIHNWFVNNVQDGNDDCGDYYVSTEQLKQLLTECEAVLTNKDKAAELLPTQSGFFYGGTDYDEYYYQDCQETISIIKETLEQPAEYYYRASW